MSRLRALSVALLLGVGVLLLNAVTAGATSRQSRHTGQDFPPRPGGTPVLVVTIPTTPPSPGNPSAKKPHSALSSQAALHIAETDRYVRALTKGKAYRIGRISSVRGGKRAALAFYHAFTITGWWLHAARRPFHATYRHVLGLRIDVAGNLGQVTAIAPRTR